MPTPQTVTETLTIFKILLTLKANSDSDSELFIQTIYNDKIK